MGTKNILNRDQTNCLRGIAALLIAIFHVLIAWELPRIINLTGSVCVAAFLFLSGFGINESYKKSGLKQYWRKRLKRIILPYTLFITVLIPFTPSFNLQDYVLDITYIHSSYWFIEFLVWNYLLYWVAQRFFKSRVITVFIVAGLLGINLLMQMEAEQVASFVAGIWVSRHIDALRNSDGRWVVKVGVFSFLLGFAFLMLKEIPAVHAFKGEILYNYILLLIKLPIAIPMLLLPTIWPVIVRSKVLYWCGISSLEIYLVHLAMVDYIYMDYWRLLAFIVLTVVLTYAFYQINHKLIARLI